MGDGGSSAVVFCRPWSTEAAVERVPASTPGEDRGAAGGGVGSQAEALDGRVYLTFPLDDD